MQSFRGNLVRDGQTVVEGVQGNVTIDVGRTGTESWSGYFTVETPGLVHLGDNLELVLDSGKTGKIQISRVNSYQGRPDAVSFEPALV